MILLSKRSLVNRYIHTCLPVCVDVLIIYGCAYVYGHYSIVSVI